MFCDETQITVQAGKGGDGLMSFRRVKFNAKGGPDGGDGGEGGAVILEGNRNLNTLSDLHSKRFFVAKNGGSGGKNNKHGANGEDLILEVPLGTRVLEVGDKGVKEEIFDIKEHGMQAVVVRGGRGGYGNAHFTASTRQTPRFAEKGEPGEVMEVALELQMIADVGIIGYPSAGKSTLISVISAAKPKIGAYPFTTLVPNLGVVKMKEFGGSPEQDFVVADVPGLIEGAHEGKGLGDQFLRHIERTAVLVHMVDLTREDYIESYEVINNELMLFDPLLVQREQLVVLSKIDAFAEDDLEEREKAFLEKYPFLVGKTMRISSVQQKGLKELVFKISELVAQTKAEMLEDLDQLPSAEEGEKFKVFRPHLENPQSVTVELVGEKKYEDPFTREFVKRKQFRLTGKRFEQIVVMTDLENEEALARVFDVLSKKRVDKELKKFGAGPGDRLLIGEADIEWPGA